MRQIQDREGEPKKKSIYKGADNSRTVKVMLSQLKLNLYFVVISIVYKFDKIRLRQTNSENRKKIAVFQFL